MLSPELDPLKSSGSVDGWHLSVNSPQCLSHIQCLDYGLLTALLASYVVVPSPGRQSQGAVFLFYPLDASRVKFPEGVRETLLHWGTAYHWLRSSTMVPSANDGSTGTQLLLAQKLA